MWKQVNSTLDWEGNRYSLYDGRFWKGCFGSLAFLESQYNKLDVSTDYRLRVKTPTETEKLWQYWRDKNLYLDLNIFSEWWLTNFAGNVPLKHEE